MVPPASIAVKLPLSESGRRRRRRRKRRKKARDDAVGAPLLHLAHPKLFDTVFGSIRTPEACEASRITVRRRILIL